MVEHPTLNSCYDKDLAVKACRSDSYFKQFVIRISSNMSSKCERVFVGLFCANKWVNNPKFVWASVSYNNSLIFVVRIVSNSDNQIVRNSYPFRPLLARLDLEAMIQLCHL